MKTEKPKIEQHGSAERIETKKFDQGLEKEIFYLDNDLQIHEAKDLLSQRAATLDFEDDGSGKAGSVTVRRVLDNSIIFYSKEERDIKKFLN